jgi:hypothetical protein
MKLAEMSTKSTRKINKLMESRFGFAINFSDLTVEKAERLSETIVANLDKIRHSVDLHTAERNPRSIQDAIEKVGKMQNEQLPELLDSIRDQVGAEQAEGFKNAVGTTLETLMQNLQTAREGVDGGVRILTGEQVDNPMAMPGDDLSGGDAGLPPAPGSDLDQDETDGFGATDAAVGGAEELGRELR